MGDSDDLFDIYRKDQGKAALTGPELAAALADTVRRSLALIEELCAEVTRALAQARYSTRLAQSVTDRSSYVRLDRRSEGFRDYLRTWSQQRADRVGGGMHWEAQILVTDHRRTTKEIGIGIAFEWPGAGAGGGEGAGDGGLAFVEFWPTGTGVSLPADARGFQRALVACIIKLEQAGELASVKERG
ncbi:hypothetical protein [Azospirillum sp. B506]|uniref:hypothetical protein n=1 Tax=Azospirillum sp. B506 TaxID=137721 RepID=UPI00034B16FD|nr:hypothetical protein [Azospirillum sp. B506]